MQEQGVGKAQEGETQPLPLAVRLCRLWPAFCLAGVGGKEAWAGVALTDMAAVMAGGKVTGSSPCSSMT